MKRLGNILRRDNEENEPTPWGILPEVLNFEQTGVLWLLILRAWLGSIRRLLQTRWPKGKLKTKKQPKLCLAHLYYCLIPQDLFASLKQ